MQCSSSHCELSAEKQVLSDEILRLQEIVAKKDLLVKKVLTFLNEDQLSTLMEEKKRYWSNEAIIKGLKLRCALGVNRYKYLLGTNYPAPSYSTITSRLKQYKINFGIFEILQEPLKHKVSRMEETDKFCMLSMDEMEISKQLAYNKSERTTVGHITLPAGTTIGTKLLIVLVRGIKQNWKQVIAAHVTNGSAEDEVLRQFIDQCIQFCNNCGLKVIALGSDMGHENRALWRVLNVRVPRFGVRQNMFDFNGESIYIVNDVCHLIKNLKNALLTSWVKLPAAYCQTENLQSPYVHGSIVKVL